ncbi:MAG TPA: DnaJ domain-containing protein [Caulobacteraceae bacterium]|nr:DnaJ domain-containing protein [Caulobacteraceae bacterium]
MILALAVLALAVLAAYGRRSLAGRAQGRLLVAFLAALTAGAAVYEGLRGVWLGALVLIGAAVWVGAGAQPPRNVQMSRRDAAAMLGVSEDASRDQINAAFRRLMRRVHPDQGGAPGLAAQLNAARAALLKL